MRRRNKTRRRILDNRIISKHPTPAVKAAGFFIWGNTSSTASGPPSPTGKAWCAYHAERGRLIKNRRFLVCDFCFVVIYYLVNFFFLLCSSAIRPASIISAKTIRYQTISRPCFITQAVRITAIPQSETAGRTKRFTG